jgi:hypothetical protein
MLTCFVVGLLVVGVAVRARYRRHRHSGAQTQVDPSGEAWLPARLKLSSSFGPEDISFAREVGTGQVPAIDMPCGVVPVAPGKVYLCNYSSLYLIDLDRGTVETIAPPPGTIPWVPTGLAYDEPRKLLYVANYTGKNILAFKVKKGFGLELVRDYRDPRLVTPESVAVSKDGTLLAVADYDGQGVLLLHKNGQQLWFASIGLGHGVAFFDDDRHVVASSLATRQLCKLETATGTLVCKVGSMGWGKDGYLWPVCVAANGPQELLTSDAHTGKITFLSPDLHTIRSLGGNGPDDTFFNMPYAVHSLPGGKLLVTDTLRPRLVQIDQASGAVDKILYLHRGYLQDCYSLPGSTLGKASKSSLPQIPLRLFRDPAAAPLGLGYDGYMNRQKIVTLKLPLLGNTYPTRWREGYCELIDADSGKHQAGIEMSTSTLLYTASLYYFVFGHNPRQGEREYTILWSQSCSTVLCIRDGMAVPLSLKIDLWPAGDDLSDHGRIIRASDLVRAAEAKIGLYERLLKEEQVEPLEAARQALFPGRDGPAFLAAVTGTFKSEPGKAFLRAYLNAKDNGERLRAAEAYGAALAARPWISLPEVFLAHTLVHGLHDKR